MKLATRKNYPIVEVIWYDAEEYGDVGWNDLKVMLVHAKKPCPEMHTVGYCVYRCKEYISILSTIGPKEASTLEKIPTGMVKSINIIERKTTNAPV